MTTTTIAATTIVPTIATARARARLISSAPRRWSQIGIVRIPRSAETSGNLAEVSACPHRPPESRTPNGVPNPIFGWPALPLGRPTRVGSVTLGLSWPGPAYISAPGTVRYRARGADYDWPTTGASTPFGGKPDRGWHAGWEETALSGVTPGAIRTNKT